MNSKPLTYCIKWISCQNVWTNGLVNEASACHTYTYCWSTLFQHTYWTLWQ